jgi:hypothetical protein
MWQGIVVQNGGTLITNNYSIIEDAVQAVYTSTTGTASAVPNYTVTNTIFNNNATGIYVDVNTNSLSSNTIYNTVFTCRSINSHALTSTNFNNTKKDIRLATPLLTSTVNPTDHTLAGSRSKYGIYINQTGKTNPVNVGIGTQANNLFDNLDYGIYSTASYLVSKNCRFQNITGNSNGYPGTLPIGIGIYADNGTVDVINSQLIVGNSTSTKVSAERDTFANCLVGVATNKLNNMAINYNYFNNETTASTFTTAGSYVTGLAGTYNLAYAKYANGSEGLGYNNNYCANYSYGHYLDFCKLYNTSVLNTAITSNTITATGTGTVTNQYCNIGLYAQQEATSNGANTGVPLTAVYIASNSITNVNNNCIWVYNVNNSSATGGFFDIQQNTELSIKQNTYTAQPIPTQPIAAVLITGSWYTRCSDNSNIRCTGLSGTTIPSTQYQAGIYVYQSPRTTANCNTVSNIGESFVWESTSPSYTLNSSSFQRNNLDYSRYGLVLRNTGVMGNQGNSTYPINNLWGTGTTAHFAGAQTLADHSDPSTSPTSILYEASPSNCTLTPCSNTYTNTPATAYASGSTLLSASGSNTLFCASDGTGGGGGGSGRMAFDTSAASIAQDSLRVYFKSLLTSNTALPAYDYETKWALRHHIHSLMPSINAATSIYGNAKAFAAIDGKLAAADYNGAQSLLNAVSPNNIIEQNFMDIDNMVIKLQNDSPSNNDINTITNVAKQCPLTGGSVVWRARALLNTYYGTVVSFPDVCATAGNGLRMAETNNIESVSNNQLVTVYPNPTTGKITIDYNLQSNGQLHITDITGKLIYTQMLNAAEKTIDINMESLMNGVYLYTLTNEKGLVKTGRIVILK